MKWLPICVALGAALLLSACAYGDAAIGMLEGKSATAINQVKRLNDAEATIMVQVPCAMDVGAFYRALNPVQQQAVSTLCGGEAEKPITAEDLARVNTLLGIASGIPPRVAQPLAPPPEPGG